MGATIWKFRLRVVDEQTLTMSRGAEVLTVQVQHGEPCIWVKVDPCATSEVRTFFIFGTGHPMPDESLRYVGTFQVEDGLLVFHVFESNQRQ